MSGTDENDLVRKFALRGFLVNLVVNRKGEMTCQVDSMVGPENGKPDDFVLVTVPNVLTIPHVRPAAIVEQVTREIAQNVKAAPHITYTRGRAAGFQGHLLGDDDDFNIFGSDYKGKYTRDVPVKKGRDECWLFNKSRNSLDCFDVDGVLLKRIDKAGKGKLTVFDSKGNPVMVTNSRTAGPKDSDKKRLASFGFGPAEL